MICIYMENDSTAEACMIKIEDNVCPNNSNRNLKITVQSYKNTFTPNSEGIMSQLVYIY